MRSNSEIKSEALNILNDKKWIGPALVCAFQLFLAMMMSFVLSAMQTNNFYITLLIELMLYICIIIPVSMGVSIYMLKLVRGEHVSVGNIFDGYLYAVKMIPLAIISLIGFALTNYVVGLALVNHGNMVYLIPAIITALLYAVVEIIIKFSYYLIYDNDGNVIQSFSTMVKYMLNGGLWKYLVLVFSFIIWFVVAAFTLGIVLLLVIPYVTVAATLFYEDIEL